MDCVTVMKFLRYETETHMNLTVPTFIAWMMTAIAIALTMRRAKRVYWTCVAMATIPITITQIESEFLIMGGIVHALCMGVYPTILFWIARWIRARRRNSLEAEPERPDRS